MIEHRYDAGAIHRHPRTFAGPYYELGLLSVNDLPDDTTGSHDVVPLLDRGQHHLVSLSFFCFGSDQHEVEDCDHQAHHTHVDDHGVWPPGNHHQCIKGKIHWRSPYWVKRGPTIQRRNSYIAQATLVTKTGTCLQ